jgi:hypothetical protein
VADYNRFEDDDLSVIVLVNTESVLPKSIAIELASQFIPGLSLERTTIKLTPEVLEQYAGQYQISADNVLTILVDGNNLSMQSSAGGAQFILRPENLTTFFISKDESYVFNLNDDGNVTHLTILYGENEELRASRLP